MGRLVDEARRRQTRSRYEGGPGVVPSDTSARVVPIGKAYPIQYGDSDQAAPVAVGPLALWQLQNLKLDGALRLGLPVVAYLARTNHRMAALAAVAVAGVLWANRLTRINL